MSFVLVENEDEPEEGMSAREANWEAPGIFVLGDGRPTSGETLRRCDAPLLVVECGLWLRRVRFLAVLATGRLHRVDERHDDEGG